MCEKYVTSLIKYSWNADQILRCFYVVSYKCKYDLIYEYIRWNGIRFLCNKKITNNKEEYYSSLEEVVFEYIRWDSIRFLCHKRKACLDTKMTNNKGKCNSPLENRHGSPGGQGPPKYLKVTLASLPGVPWPQSAPTSPREKKIHLWALLPPCVIFATSCNF